MTLSVLPSLIGVSWPVARTQKWDSAKQDDLSGKKIRSSLFSYPIYNYELKFNFLRSTASLQEYQQLKDFISTVGGATNLWAFNDVNDNSVTSQNFGTGDGSTQYFQLVRTLYSFNEPVFILNGAPAIYQTSWQGAQLQYTTPRTNYLEQSNAFATSPWALGGSPTVAQNVVGPDGAANSGWTLTAGIAGTADFQQNVTAPTSGTIFFWAQAGTDSYIYVGVNDAGGAVATSFHISAGTVGTQNWGLGGSPVVVLSGATIQSAGGGWYLCSVNWAGAAVTVVRFGVADSDAVNTATSGKTALFAFTQAGSPGSYIPTTTGPVTVTDYSISVTGNVAFHAAPATGVALTWTGAYYWPCRFDDDQTQFVNFYQNLWQLKTLKFSTEKVDIIIGTPP